MKSNKSQAWGIDLMTASIIFIIGIVIFLVYSINYSGETKETFEKLTYDGEVILNSILSEGYPKDWNSENIVTIGILDNNKINETKLEKFYDLAEDDYPKTKTLFNTNYNYYFFLDKDMTIRSLEIEGIGKPGATKSSIESDAVNLIKITRFIVYKEKPTTAYLYIWGE